VEFSEAEDEKPEDNEFVLALSAALSSLAIFLAATAKYRRLNTP
jgi:hypothetical protein